ncbi:MAG: hypothetical protein AAF799_19465 [Myxococcota bacterium]
MAHILVYLQRTPGGLHPASAVALCRARDIASDRGASLTSVCPGDAGAVDKGLATAASRFGADVLVFGGPKGLLALFEQLNPVHVLVPWTDEGLQAATDLPSGPAVPRWLNTRQPAWGGADSVTAVVAGTLPWHAYSEPLEAEYQADVDDATLPDWLAEVRQKEENPSFGIGDGPIRWVGTATPDDRTTAALARLGAEPAPSPAEAVADQGTVLWISSEPVPEALANRPPGLRLVVLPDEGATSLDPSWRSADWVLPGPAATALAAIADSPWAPSRG